LVIRIDFPMLESRDTDQIVRSINHRPRESILLGRGLLDDMMNIISLSWGSDSSLELLQRFWRVEVSSNRFFIFEQPRGAFDRMRLVRDQPSCDLSGEGAALLRGAWTLLGNKWRPFENIRRALERHELRQACARFLRPRQVIANESFD